MALQSKLFQQLSSFNVCFHATGKVKSKGLGFPFLLFYNGSGLRIRDHTAYLAKTVRAVFERASIISDQCVT